MRKRFAYTETLSLTGGKNIALPGIGEISESKMLFAIMIMVFGLIANTTLLGHLLIFLVGLAVLAVPETSVGFSRTAIGVLNYYFGKKKSRGTVAEETGTEEVGEAEEEVQEEEEVQGTEEQKKGSIISSLLSRLKGGRQKERNTTDHVEKVDGKRKVEEKKEIRPIMTLMRSLVVRHWQSMVGSLMIVASLELFMLDPVELMVESIILLVIGLILLVVDYISTVLQK